MKKVIKIILVSCFMLVGGFIILGLTYSDEDSLFEMPPEIQKYQAKFKQLCQQGYDCAQYGLAPLIKDFNTGRMRPKQRRLVWHQSLNTMQDEIDKFPSTEKKSKAMENIAERMARIKG